MFPALFEFPPHEPLYPAPESPNNATAGAQLVVSPAKSDISVSELINGVSTPVEDVAITLHRMEQSVVTGCMDHDKDLKKGDCGIRHIADILRPYMAEDVFEWPDGRILSHHRDLKAAVRHHRENCKFKLHSGTGKAHSHVIALSLLTVHRNDLEDVDGMIETIKAFRSEFAADMSSRKETAYKDAWRIREDRYIQILQHNQLKNK